MIGTKKGAMKPSERVGSHPNSSSFYFPFDDFFGVKFDQTLAESARYFPREQALVLHEYLAETAWPAIPPVAPSDVAISPIVRPWDINLPLLRTSIATAQLVLADWGGSGGAFGMTSSGLERLDSAVSANPGIRIRTAIDALDAVDRKTLEIERLVLYSKTVRIPVDVLFSESPKHAGDELAWAQWVFDARIKLETLARIRTLVDLGYIEIGSWNRTSLKEMPRGEQLLNRLKDVPLDPAIRLNVTDASGDPHTRRKVESLVGMGLAFDQFAWTLLSSLQVGGTILFTNDALRLALNDSLELAHGPRETLLTLTKIVVPDPQLLSMSDIVELRASDAEFARFRSALTRVAQGLQDLPIENWQKNARDLAEQELQPEVIRLNAALRRSRALGRITERAGIKFGVGVFSVVGGASVGALNLANPAIAVMTGLTSAAVSAVAGEVGEYVLNRSERRTSSAALDVYASLLGSGELSFGGMRSSALSNKKFWSNQDEAERWLGEAGIDLLALRREVAAEDLISTVTLLLSNRAFGVGETQVARELLARLETDANPRLAGAASFETAISYQREGNPTKARQKLRAILGVGNLKLLWPHVHLALGSSYFESGNSRSAFRHLKAALGSDEPYVVPRAAAILGEVYSSRNQPEEALRHYEIAISSDQIEPQTLAWLNKASLLDDLGRQEEAKRAYWSLAKLDRQPWSSQALHDLGCLFIHLDNARLAARLWRCCASGPDSEWKWRSALALGNLLSESDLPEEREEGMTVMRIALPNLKDPQRSVAALLLAISMIRESGDSPMQSTEMSGIYFFLDIASESADSSITEHAEQLRVALVDLAEADEELSQMNAERSGGLS